MLPGEGQYNLNSLKEIEATVSFFTLDQDVRGCQNREPFIECQTREYLDKIFDQYGCLPYTLSSNKKVLSL